MIEDVLKDLTSAIRENTQAILEQSKPVVEAVSEAPVETKKNDKVSKIKPSKKAKQEEPEAESTPEITMNDIVQFVTKEGIKRADLVDLLTEMKAKKLPDLSADQLPVFFEKLKDLATNEAA